jgi:TfoX/Sxy family transcriptional regulator of competence genes
MAGEEAAPMPDKTPMPTFDKSPAELVDRFTGVLATRPEATTRKTFGYPAAYVNGNMTTGLHQANWFVRLSELDTTELITAGGGPFEPMVGRPMRGYTVLPADVRDDPEEAGRWVDLAIAHVASLPPKK